MKLKVDVVIKRKIKDLDDADVLILPPSKTQKTYVKHPDHWALDGNVLLQIEDTRFSLHRSRLAAHSRWFEALFAARSLLPFDSGYAGMQAALESVEVVNGQDLFYIDLPSASVYVPVAGDFAALLTAMDNAIEYVNDRPSFNVLLDILVAAHFYCFNKFEEFAKDCLIALFPQTVQAITSTEIPNASLAISIGGDYDIHELWPASFYQLARLKPPINNDKIADLSPADLAKLLNLQKRIVLLWDDILDIVAHDCKVPTCVMFHTQQVRIIKKEHPLDPIVGISKLIKYDWGAGAGSCTKPSPNFTNQLKVARLKFWRQMKKMLDPVD